jgi:hypothetical protein
MKTKHIGYLGMGVWLILCVIIIVLMISGEPYVETTISLDRPYLCKNTGVEWLEVENFNVGDNIHICAVIRSNKVDLRSQIQVRVYQDELTMQANAIYYDNIWISNGEVAIPLDTYLLSGIYIVQISYGKTTLGIMQIDVVE